MKKFVVSIAVFLSALAALAAENVTPAVCVWTGAASSEWDNAGNWLDGVRPGNNDVALFRSDASVFPPDSFCGVLQLEGAVVVTAFVSGTSDMTLHLASSSAGVPSFVKRGNGSLVLRVARGINPGTVTVAEGSVDFAQNASGEPGAFDRIVIAAGAFARVVDSPFATRHGVAVKAGFMSFEASALPEDFGGFSNNGNESYYYFAGGSGSKGLEAGNETQSLADRLDYMWDTSFSLTTLVERCFVSTETLPALCGTNSMPQELFSAQQQTVTYTRAIVLSENANAIRRTIQNGTGGGSMSAWVLDGAEFARCTWGGVRYDKSVSLSRGFHALNVSLWSECKYGWKQNWTTLSRKPIHRDDTGCLTPDVLWNGVCCNALTVEAGATLTIAEGQALGVARAEDLTVAGQILSAGSTACISLLSSYAPDGVTRSNAKLLEGFDDFKGLIEIGRTVHVRLPDDASLAEWTIFGKGTVTVVSGSEPCFGTQWTGTVDIPRGEVFDVPQTWSDDVSVVGDGAVVSGDLDVTSMTTFGGSVKLEDGDSLNVSSAELLSSYRETLPSPLDATSWTYFGTSHVSHITAPDGTTFNVDQSSLPRSEDGKLVLTWAANHQRHAAFMTGYPIALDDTFDFSFTVSASIPPRTEDDTVPPYAGVHGWLKDFRAGNFSLAFSGVEPGTLADENRPGFLPAGSQRLQFNFYDAGSSTGPVAYFGETPVGGRMVGPSGGIDPSKPWRMRVCGANGRALVTLIQEDLQYTIDWDIRSVFDAGDNVYLALAGHSDWWGDGNNAVPWIRLEVSDFAGWISSADDRCMNLSGESNPDANMALSPANWNYKWAGNNSESDSAVWPDDGTLMLLPRTDVGSHALRYAVCKSPVSANQAFELAFDLTFSKSASTSTAAVWAFYLQTEGSSPAMTGAQDNGLGEVTLKNTPGYGIGISTYGNKPYWWSGLGGKATAPILKEFEANSIKISAGKANRLTVRYDGCGLMYLRFESDGKTVEGTYFFEDLLKETKPLFLTFATGTAWANCGTIKLSNLTLTKKAADIDRLTAWPTPLVIAPGASATLNVGTVDRPPSVPQIAYDDVRLGDGTVLSVENEAGSSATHVSLSPVVDGNACICSGTDAVVTVSDATFVSSAPSKLSLTGTVCFADSFTVTIPLGWLDAIDTEHVLMDFSTADIESPVPSQIVLKDETGSVMTARLRIVRRGNTFVLLKKGFVVIVR